MAKNYMPEVARMLGVEIGERFDAVENGITSPCGPFYFDENWKIRDNNNGVVPYWFLEKILTGEYTLQKRLWKPKEGERYYFICSADGFLSCLTFRSIDATDLALLNMGNCFPTQEAAEAGKEEILAKLEEIRKEVWE